MYNLSMSFHVQPFNDNIPSFNKIKKGDSTELIHWYNTIEAELQALHEKPCFYLVDKSKAKG